MRTNKFKLIGLLVYFAAAAMTMSCTKDSKTIVGTWGCIHNYDHYWSTEYYAGQPFDRVDNTDLYRGEVISFKDDGRYTSSESDPDWGFYYNGIWMIDGNSLLIDGHPWNIQKLNNTTLILQTLYYYNEETINEEKTIEFKRQ